MASTKVGAQEVASFDERPVNVGIGTAWASPVGNAESGTALSEVMTAQVPLVVDVSFRALPRVFVGAYAGLGGGVLGDCAACSGRDLRFGLNGRYAFRTHPGWVPWVELGAGYETLTVRIESEKTNFHGVTFVDLGTGLDVPLCPALAVGPTLTLSVGEFSRATAGGINHEADGARVEAEIEDTTLHGWLLLGFRAVIAP